MEKLRNFLNLQRVLFFSFILMMMFGIYTSYAYFMMKTKDYRATEMMITNLTYMLELEGDDVTDKTVALGPGEIKTVLLKITSVNEINSKYKIEYTSDNGLVEVKYADTTKDMPSGSIENVSEQIEAKEVLLYLINNGNTETTVSFDVNGGYVHNDTDAIKIDEDYREIVDAYYTDSNAPEIDVLIASKNTYQQQKQVSISLSDAISGVKSGTYDIYYLVDNESSYDSCTDIKNAGGTKASIAVSDGSATLSRTFNATNSIETKYLHVCNDTAIEDTAGNTLEDYVYSDILKLDGKEPILSVSVNSAMNGATIRLNDSNQSGVVPGTYNIKYAIVHGEGSITCDDMTESVDVVVDSTGSAEQNIVFNNYEVGDNLYVCNPTNVSDNVGNTLAGKTVISEVGEYVITYNINGGVGNIESQIKLRNQNITLTLQTPTKTGYTFIGWSTNQNATTIDYESGATFSINANTTLYAIYKENHTVNVQLTNGTLDDEYKTVVDGNTAEFTFTADTGYSDNGTVTCTNNQSGTVNNGKVIINNVSNSTVCTVELDIQTFNVEYDANGGQNAPSTQIKTYNESLTLSSDVPTRSGYSFLGWTINEESSLVVYHPGDSYIVNNDIILYAVWAKNHQITVNVIGGSTSPSTKEVQNGNSIGFDITEDDNHLLTGSVVCSNDQNGIYSNGRLVVNTVTNDSTCTVTLDLPSDTTPPTAPTIMNMAYNVFAYESTDDVEVTGYYISTENVAPTKHSTWVTTTSFEVSDEGTYYVWARDEVGNISQSSSINAYTITRSEGKGTTLITQILPPFGGTFTDDIVVLEGISIRASASIQSEGFSDLILKHGSTNLATSGGTFVVNASETIASSATAETYTITVDANGGTIPTTENWNVASGNTTATKTYDYGDNLVGMPIPVKEGYTFDTYKTVPTILGLNEFHGDDFISLGRTYFYPTPLSMHVEAYMDNWALADSKSMRLMSSTETGGVAIWSNSNKIYFNVYDYGVGYKNIATTKSMASLSAGWHTFDLIYNGTKATGYVDGTSLGSSSNFTGSGKKLGYNASNGLFVGAEAYKDIYYPVNLDNNFVGQMKNIVINNNSTRISGITDANSDTPVPRANTTYYAAYTKNSYTINYDLDGGLAGTSAPTHSKYGEVVNISNPTKTGFIFNGWTVVSDSNTSNAMIGTSGSTVTTAWNDVSTPVMNEYFKNLSVDHNATVTMVANWTPLQFTITMNANGGTLTMPDDESWNMAANNLTATKTYDYGNELGDIPIPVKEGYTFDTYKTVPTILGLNEFHGDDFISLGRTYNYATPLSMHVEAYMDNWALADTNSMRLLSSTESGGVAIYTNGKITFNSYDYGVGYKYVTTTKTMASLGAGWHTFDLIYNGTKATGYVDGTSVGSSSNFTGSGKKLGYNASNGLFVGAEAYNNIYYPANLDNNFIGDMKNIVINNNSTRISNVIDANGESPVPLANTTYYAAYTKNSYTIEYDLGDDGILGIYAPIHSKYGEVVNISNPTRPGYVFNGWTLVSDSNTNNAMIGTSVSTVTTAWSDVSTPVMNEYFKNLSVDHNAIVTMVANWIPLDYTITLDANGGTLDSDTIGDWNLASGNLTASKSITYGESVGELPEPTREGYTFDSWKDTSTILGLNEFHGEDFISLGRTYMYTNKLSVHFDAYMDDWSEYTTQNMRIMSSTESGGWNILPLDGLISFDIYDSGTGYKHFSTNTYFSDLDSGWHTFDLTFNGTKATAYLDGAVIGNSANFSSGKIGYNASNGIFIGGEAGADVYFPAAGSYFIGDIDNLIINNNDTVITEVNDIDSDTLIPPINTTYYASYIRNSYTINYNMNGGTKGLHAPTHAKYGEVVNISNPTRRGYIFDGWTVSSGLNTNTAKYGADVSELTTDWDNPSTEVLAEYFKDLTSTNDGVVTLVANWSPVSADVLLLADASYSGNEATITFTASAIENESTIERYVIYYKDVTDSDYTTIEIVSSDSSVTTTVPGTSGATYNFYVVVYNTAGISKPSGMDTITLQTYSANGTACGYNYGSWSKDSTTSVKKSSCSASNSSTCASCTSYSTCGTSVTYKSCSTTTSNTTDQVTCTKGTAKTCSSSSGSWVSACSSQNYIRYCKTASGGKDYSSSKIVTSCTSSGCTYGIESCTTYRYVKTTSTISAGTAYVNKTTYTRTKTAKTCWHE